MTRDVDHVPRRVSDMAMTFVGEGVALAESQAGFDDIALTAKKAGGIFKVSSELDEDSIDSAAANWIDQAYAAALVEDKPDPKATAAGMAEMRGVIPAR